MERTAAPGTTGRVSRPSSTTRSLFPSGQEKGLSCTPAPVTNPLITERQLTGSMSLGQRPIQHQKRQEQADSGIPKLPALLSSLFEVKSALETFNSRIDSWNKTRFPLPANVNKPSPSSSTHASTPLPADVTPPRTLGNEVSAPTTGSSFLNPEAAIPDLGITY